MRPSRSNWRGKELQSPVAQGKTAAFIFATLMDTAFN